MFTYTITLFRVAGIPVRLDASWFLIAIVLTWSMASQFAFEYPAQQHPELTAAAHWTMGGVVAVGLFVCILLHELGHSLVGQRFGLRIRSITLFVFGGVAEPEEEPRSARVEFWMTLAGPIVSLVLAAAFRLVALLGTTFGWPIPVVAVLQQLALVNAVVVAFNLVPAFPLDGGRILRAFLWSVTGNLKRATAVTTRIGEGFGIVMMLLGLFGIMGGQLIVGLWWLMLGYLLRSAAQGSYTRVMVRGVLEGERVRRFMTVPVTCVPPELGVEELVEEYVYRQHHRMYPVCADGRLLGYVTPREIKQVPREDWPRHRVKEIMATDLEGAQIAPDADALDALARMQQNDQSRLLVVEKGTLVGILTLKDLLDFLQLKIELG